MTAVLSLAKVGSKKGFHGESWRITPLTDHGPSRRICCIACWVEHLTSRKPLGKSDMRTSPNELHLERSSVFTWSNVGGFPNSLPYRACWNFKWALLMVSPSRRMKSVVECLILLRMWGLWSGELSEDSCSLEAICAKDLGYWREGRAGCLSPLAMARGTTKNGEAFQVEGRRVSRKRHAALRAIT